MTEEIPIKIIEGENIKVELKESDGCKVVMEIYIHPKATQASYKKALKNINKEVSIPGYRKGKAPEAIIKKNYEKYLSQEWEELLLNTAFEETVALTKIFPLSRNAVKKAKIVESSYDKGAKAVFDFEKYPTIPEVNASEIEIHDVKSKIVSDEDVQKSVENVRKMFESLDTFDDRAVEEGDIIELQLEKLGDETEVLFSSRQFLLGDEDKTLEPWLKDLVMGMRVGECKEGENTLHESAGDEEKENFTAEKHKVTLKGAKGKKLPEVDDALAERVGLKTVDELLGRLRERLEQEAEFAVTTEKHKQVTDFLLANYDFDLPETFIASEKEASLKSRIRQLKAEKKTDEDLKSQEKELEEDAIKQSKEKLRLFFLLQNIAEKENLKVSNDEISDKVASSSAEFAMSGWSPQTKEDHERLRSHVSSMLLEEKVKDFLVNKAKLVAYE